MFVTAGINFIRRRWLSSVTPLGADQSESSETSVDDDMIDTTGRTSYTLINEDKHVINNFDITLTASMMRPFWLIMVFPKREDIVSTFPSIHPLSLWEIFDVPNLVREKVDAFDDYLYINTNDEKSVQLHIFLFRDNSILTILTRLHRSYRSSHPSIDLVRRKIEEMNYRIPSHNFILHSLISALLSLGASTLSEMIELQNQIDYDIAHFSAKSTNASLNLLKRIQQVAVRSSRTYWFTHSKQQMLISLSLLLPTQTHINLQHLQQLLMNQRYRLQLLREGLDSSRDTFLNSIGLVANMQIEKANKDSNRFAALFTLLTPMMVVLGLFSMNVPIPGGWDGGEDRRHIWFYWFVAVFVVVIVTGVIYGLQHRLI